MTERDESIQMMAWTGGPATKPPVPKVIRDGKVAVLYSPGYGAGWSTWAHDSELAKAVTFDPDVVALIEAGKKDEIGALIEVKYPGKYFYTGGAVDLEIEWVPQGARFYIHEYDGYESVRYGDSDPWEVA